MADRCSCKCCKRCNTSESACSCESASAASARASSARVMPTTWAPAKRKGELSHFPLHNSMQEATKRTPERCALNAACAACACISIGTHDGHARRTSGAEASGSPCRLRTRIQAKMSAENKVLGEALGLPQEVCIGTCRAEHVATPRVAAASGPCCGVTTANKQHPPRHSDRSTLRRSGPNLTARGCG